MHIKTLIGAAALLLAACSGQGDPCVTDNDCFFGETCNDSFCGDPIPAFETDDGTPNGQTGTGDGGMSTTDTDGGASPNNVGDQDAGANNVNNINDRDLATPVDVGPMGPCWADAFDVCTDDEDPDNNSFPGVAFAPMTRGCQSSGFVPLDMTISGRQCALDPEDQYYITVVECDDDEPGMIVEATLDVKDDCNPADIWFDVEQIGTSCANPNPDSDKTLRCETLPGGERRISVIWPGASVPTVGSIRFSLQTPDRQDIEFDYDLRIVIREP